MSLSAEGQRALLLRVARETMIARGLAPDFPPAALAEAGQLAAPRPPFGAEVRDLRALPWCSIDNDDSLDLDQLTAAEALPEGATRVLVAVADVSASVRLGSALDDHAAANTTSVYTPPMVFPMLPPRLSNDLTSLNEGEDRLAVVVATVVDGDGAATGFEVYRALVRSQAKLAYSGVGAWLEGRGPLPEAAAKVPGLADNLRLQDQAAALLKARRHEQGALEFETVDVRARFEGDKVAALAAEERNRAKDLIADFMIASNGSIARLLEERRFPVMRRMVRSPERWQRIVDIAATYGEPLPPTPEAKALNTFLVKRRAADPLRFPDLSLAIIKLMGRGEYVIGFPGENTAGHFGLAVSEYTHSTAPNRRFPDLITQRLVKAALAGEPPPYPRERLEALASHCTQKEDDAEKVERLLRKAAAACLLSDRIGQEFDGLVTGAGDKGSWARIFDPPAEGRVEQGAQGLDVGDRVRLRLIHVDPERGFIDFARIGHQPVGPRRR